jgi:hypothetical protein
MFRTLRHFVLPLALIGCAAARGETTIFAFDDHTIPFRHNLVVTMVKAEKYSGNPILSTGPAGTPDSHRVQFFGSVIRIGGKYHMWYSADDQGRAGGTQRGATRFRIAYAESADGIHWQRPSLGLVEYNGNKSNNLVEISPEPPARFSMPSAVFVLYEPDDPNPARRYKMVTYGFYWRKGLPGPQNATIYTYFSGDGLRWNLAQPRPKGDVFDETESPLLLSFNFEIGGVYRFNGVYYVAGQEFSPDVTTADGKSVGRVMVTHWSTDFIHWSKERSLSFVPYGYRSELDDSRAQAHEAASVWNRGNVLLGTYGMWRGARDPGMEAARMPLGLLISNDGIHFREPVPDFAVIDVGKDGEWDQRGLIQGQGFENIGNQTYIYYGSWNLSAKKDPQGAIGIAMIRRDGFGHLSVPGEPVWWQKTARVESAALDEALFSTIPVHCPHGLSGLRLNVDGLGDGARLRIEVLGEAGVTLPKYSATAKENGLTQLVHWDHNLAPPPGSYRMRIHFEGPNRKDIRFYALYVD